MLTRIQAADETPVVLGSGKQHLKKIHVFQRTFDAPALFVQLFNDATPDVGTDLPDVVLRVPPGKVDNQATYADYILGTDEGGLQYATALAVAVTTTASGGTGPTAGDEPEVLISHDPAP